MFVAICNLYFVGFLTDWVDHSRSWFGLDWLSPHLIFGTTLPIGAYIIVHWILSSNYVAWNNSGSISFSSMAWLLKKLDFSWNVCKTESYCWSKELQKWINKQLEGRTQISLPKRNPVRMRVKTKNWYVPPGFSLLWCILNLNPEFRINRRLEVFQIFSRQVWHCSSSIIYFLTFLWYCSTKLLSTLEHVFTAKISCLSTPRWSCWNYQYITSRDPEPHAVHMIMCCCQVSKHPVSVSLVWGLLFVTAFNDKRIY